MDRMLAIAMNHGAIVLFVVCNVLFVNGKCGNDRFVIRVENALHSISNGKDNTNLK